MFYTRTPQLQYFQSSIAAPITHQNQPIISSQYDTYSTQIDAYTLRKLTSKKLDLLYEQCISKSNQVLQENETRIQNYLARKSSLSSNANKENYLQSRQNFNEETAYKSNISAEQHNLQKSSFIAQILESKDQNIPQQKEIEQINSEEEDRPKKIENDEQKSLQQQEKTANLSNFKSPQDGLLLKNEQDEQNPPEEQERKENEVSPKPKNIELRLQLDELFEKCTKKTKECLEHNQLKSELHTNLPLVQTKFFEDGSFYRGILQNGLRNGLGVLYTPLGKEKYNGNWENDEFHGQGIYYITDKEYNDTWLSFEGIFLNGKLEGLGKITKRNGEIIMRMFKNGELIEETESKKDRLNTSLNKINEEEEKSGENYEEHLNQYFQEEFEAAENNGNITEEDNANIFQEEFEGTENDGNLCVENNGINEDNFKRITNDSNDNLKELAEKLEGGFDDYDLDFVS